jgi:hypothetical protein
MVRRWPDHAKLTRDNANVDNPASSIARRGYPVQD